MAQMTDDEPDDTPRVTFRMPEELRADLDELADEQNRTRSELIRDACRRYRDVQQGRMPTSETHKDLAVTVDRLVHHVHDLNVRLDELE